MRSGNKFFLVSCIVTKAANVLKLSHFGLIFPCSGDEMKYFQSKFFFHLLVHNMEKWWFYSAAIILMATNHCHKHEIAPLLQWRSK